VGGRHAKRARPGHEAGAPRRAHDGAGDVVVCTHGHGAAKILDMHEVIRRLRIQAPSDRAWVLVCR
jgi:hypothetical protein